MKSISTLLPVFIAALLVVPTLAFAQTPTCADDEKSHQFDFWIGSWDVTAGGQLAGHNIIAPILDGCVLQENWKGASGSMGSSLNFYNAQTGQWEQFWVWRNGTKIHTKGGFSDGKMILQGPSQTPKGDPVLNRITWSKNEEDGTVRQFWEVSNDDGETWSVGFDGLYTKR